MRGSQKKLAIGIGPSAGKMQTTAMKGSEQAVKRRSIPAAKFLMLLAWTGMAAGPVPAPAVHLLAHWRLNETALPHADSGPYAIDLLLDTDTAAPIARPGIESRGAELNYQDPPGVSTRLLATSSVLQSDSFGFSFWIRPVQINPGDNLLAQEMAANSSIPDYTRIAWKVSLLGNNGSGAAPLELIVRGVNRAQGDFFGTATSAAVVPLQADDPDWIHVAGGYDAQTGYLVLYINGVKTVSGNSQTGADNSDGSPLSLGSTRNGAVFVAFGGTAVWEDIQIFDSPPSDAEVAFLMANPGQPVVSNFWITNIAGPQGTNSLRASFESLSGRDYRVEAATDLEDFTPVENFMPGILLTHDAGTVAPFLDAGLEGNAPQLAWAEGGTATRLFADSAMLQTDSFGFSFWIKPVFFNPRDNLLAKEMVLDNSVPAYSRMAWQVSLLDNNGSNAAPVQFIVRGDDRTAGDFFGTAISTRTLPLFTRSPQWHHIAGGYDATTGDLRLYVDGEETLSANSTPGARNSDGAPLAIGSVRNGSDFVAFAGLGPVDDVRMFSRLPTSAEVAKIQTGWGLASEDSPSRLAWWRLNGPDLPCVDTGGAQGISSFTLLETLLDSVLGPAPRPRLYLRFIRQTASSSGFPDCE